MDPCLGMGGERINGEGEEQQIWQMYFVYVYENKMMKSDKIILRRRDGG
jgi:hypothetical protein